MRFLPFLIVLFAQPVFSDSIFSDTTYTSPTSKDTGSTTSLQWILDRLVDIEVIDPSQKYDDGLKSIKSGIAALKDYEKEKDAVKGSVSFSFSDKNNENAQGEDFSIGAGLNLTIGDFPSQTRVKLNILVEEDDNGFKENIGSFLVSHDRYINQYFEAFAFTELFTIDQLGIDRRWEVGVGVKYENHVSLTQVGLNILKLFLPEKTKALDDNYWVDRKRGTINPEVAEYLGKRYKDVKHGGKPSSDAGGKYSKAERTKLCKTPDSKDSNCSSWIEASQHHLSRSAQLLKNNDFRRGLRRHESAFEYGVSIALLKEFLDSSIDVVGLGDIAGNSVEFDIEAEQNTVFSWRPKVVYKITDDLKLHAEHYFKKRLTDDRSNREETSRFFDYGKAKVSLDYTLKGKNKITFSVAYENHIENEPFVVDQALVEINSDILAIQSPYDDQLFKRVAPDNYEQFTVGFKVGF